VDLLGETARLLNKIRPLVAHEGWLVVINNALFLPGKDFMDELKELCQSPYLSFMGKIDVPLDLTGYPETIVESPPVDPAPFNHPTKIALLNVLRKDQQK
jgi:23S rRNA (cytosine1962-C5)-methyltransferase